jgi:Zn-finger nucleic acid-binding protein
LRTGKDRFKLFELIAMKCPSCSGSPLASIRLDSQLKASTCSACEGKWLSANDYWAWLETHGQTLPEKEPEGLPIEVADSQQAKLCPDCKCIMLRYKVGHGLNFRLDQCGSCHGIWLDAQEWEALAQRNLHDEIHLIFSAPWQSQVRKEEAQQVLNTLYQDRFQADYDKIKQIKAWLSTHPEKARIMDYLTNPDPYSISA